MTAGLNTKLINHTGRASMLKLKTAAKPIKTQVESALFENNMAVGMKKKLKLSLMLNGCLSTLGACGLNVAHKLFLQDPFARYGAIIGGYMAACFMLFSGTDFVINLVDYIKNIKKEKDALSAMNDITKRQDFLPTVNNHLKKYNKKPLSTLDEALQTYKLPDLIMLYKAGANN